MKTHWLNIIALALLTVILADQVTRGRKLEELLTNARGQ